MHNKTLIIAEAGVNHNGDLNLAKELIAVAAEAGADFVKFQTFSADRLATRLAQKADYQKRTSDILESQFDMLRRLELTRSMHEELMIECNKRQIRFLSTGFDIHSLDMLAELGLDLLKIPSGEITNLPYLQHVGHFEKPVIISTGMATLEEISVALEIIENAGTRRNNITVLHCTTEYPAPMSDVNLRAMLTVRDSLGVEVGYSDHTEGIEVPIAAVAMGAKVIEKHFTLDRNLPGPDHKASLQPDELKKMVRAIRHIEQAMGDGVKRCSPSEIKNKELVRKSLVASQVIKAGDLFVANNMTVKRPGTGISPMRWHEVLGQTAKRNFESDELIEL